MVGYKLLKILILSSFLALSGCGQLVDFTHIGYPLFNGQWYGPSAADLGAISSSLQSYDPFTGQTYSDYRFANGAGTLYSGTFMGGFYDGTSTRFRALGKVYQPYNLGGTGWSLINPLSYFISNLANDVANVAPGTVDSNTRLGVFVSGAIESAFVGTAQTWQNYTGVVTPVGPKTAHPANGYGTSTAGDYAGRSYFHYVDNSFNAYLQRYTSGVPWDSSTPGIRTTGGALQTEAIYDGLGMSAFTLGEGLTVTQIATGAYHACALLSDGVVLCWGSNSDGQARGDGTSGGNQSTPFVVPLGVAVAQISTGAYHTCALTTLGQIYCWGRNDLSQVLGNGSMVTPQPTPVLTTLIGAGVMATAIATGTSHTCALTTAGAVQCWGRNTESQVNPGGAAGAQPVTAVPLGAVGGSIGTQIVAGAYHTCALTSLGTMKCWGRNESGQARGDGGVVTPQAAVFLVPLTGVAVSIGAGSHHSCAQLGNGALNCFGDNTYGQTKGDGTSGAAQPTIATVPLPFSASRFTLGSYHTCAINTLGVAYCWGKNSDGQIGDATNTSPRASVTPVTLPSGLTITAIAGGGDEAAPLPGFTCAIQNLKGVLCWGDNTNLQIGNTFVVGAQRLTPLDVMITKLTPPAVCSSCRLIATSTVDGTLFRTNLSTDDTKAFSVAADGQGNIAAVFIQKNPGALACSNTTSPITNKCEYRVFASVRSTAGIWAGPTQLDDVFSQATTSLYQNSVGAGGGTATGGIDYFTPAIAYVGSGRFLAAFAVIDNASRTSGIYVRGYTVGYGWDNYVSTLEQVSIASSPDQIRLANDLRFAGNGLGDAILVSHYSVSSDISSLSTRNYGYKMYVYSLSAGWASAVTTSSTYNCSYTALAPFLCWNLKPAVAIFPGPEAVVVFPAPNPSNPLQLRLLEMEYRE